MKNIILDFLPASASSTYLLFGLLGLLFLGLALSALSGAQKNKII